MLRRQTTTWILEIHIKVLCVPASTTHSYALQVRPKEKKFLDPLIMWFMRRGEKRTNLENQNTCERLDGDFSCKGISVLLLP
jgi:hypothetical protein